MISGLLSRLRRDTSGNILMIMGMAMVPLTFLIGFGVDYARAMKLQTQLNAAADAAALAAVAPSMILQSNSASKKAAQNMFDAQAARLPGLKNLKMTPVITDGTSGSSGALGYLRKAEISYTVESINYFGGILGKKTITVGGSASASAAQPPNVDFYLVMDNSPSMLLPATSDGISDIIDATSTSALPNGCAFACHAKIPHSDRIYVNDQEHRQILLSTGYYDAGAKHDVFYRWDATYAVLYDAAGDEMGGTSTVTSDPVITTSGKGNGLMRYETTTTTATITAYTVIDNTNGPVTIQKTTTSVDTTHEVKTRVRDGKVIYDKSSKGKAKLDTSTYDMGYWADGYWLTHNYGKIYGSPSSITLRKDDMVSAASQLIPFASDQADQYHVTYQAQMFTFDWTRSGNDSPVNTLNSLQDVSDYGGGSSVSAMFPADDYWWKNSMPTSSSNINDRATETANMLSYMKDEIPTAGSGAPGATPQKIMFLITDGMIDQPDGGGRYFGPLRTSELNECTAIKAKGIKIAILYTQYLPETLVGDSWSQSNIAPFLPAPPSPYPAGNSGSSDQVLTALKSCASQGTNGTPLVQTVTTDDNITTALQQLFSTTLQAARLVQ